MVDDPSARTSVNGFRYVPDKLVRDIDALFEPRVALTVSVALLVIFTYAIHALEFISHHTVHYATLYLIPVAFAGGLLGLRGGYIAMLFALFFERSILSDSPGRFLGVDDAVRFATLALSMFIVASVTGCLHAALRDLERLTTRLTESEMRRAAFTREVMLAVTSGRLLLAEPAELLSFTETEPCFTMHLQAAEDVGSLRHQLRMILTRYAGSHYRPADIELGTTEVATNAIKHARGAYAEIRAGDTEISVLIADRGAGISPAELARATLERGYSTRSTLGMGFAVTLETTDQLVMNTSPGGTSILLRNFNRPRPDSATELLERIDNIAEPASVRAKD